MKIKLKIAWGQKSDQILMKMAGWSAAGHLVALIVFSLLPRFSQPVDTPRATIAEIVPASALFAPAPPGPAASPAAATPEQTPSQRAEAAKEAARPSPKPPPKKEEPKIASRKKPQPEPTRATAPTKGDVPPASAPEKPSPHVEPPSGSATPPGSTPGAGISFGGATGPGGVPSIGSSAFPYDYYRSSLVAILQSNWRRPVAPEGLAQTVTCRIQFTILKTGIIQDPRMAQTSGNDALDQSALRAVYNSNPLPPLPFQYAQASVSAEVVFELTPD